MRTLRRFLAALVMVLAFTAVASPSTVTPSASAYGPCPGTQSALYSYGYNSNSLGYVQFYQVGSYASNGYFQVNAHANSGWKVKSATISFTGAGVRYFGPMTTTNWNPQFPIQSYGFISWIYVCFGPG